MAVARTSKGAPALWPAAWRGCWCLWWGRCLGARSARVAGGFVSKDRQPACVARRSLPILTKATGFRPRSPIAMALRQCDKGGEQIAFAVSGLSHGIHSGMRWRLFPEADQRLGWKTLQPADLTPGP